jgi:hypothetical protein
MLAAVRGLHQAGVRLLVGRDPGGLTPTSQGISVHRELDLLGRAGLSPTEILSAPRRTRPRLSAGRSRTDRARLPCGYAPDAGGVPVKERFQRLIEPQRFAEGLYDFRLVDTDHNRPYKVETFVKATLHTTSGAWRSRVHRRWAGRARTSI